MNEPTPNGKFLGTILRHFVTILIISFTLGGWVTKIQLDVNALSKRIDKLETLQEKLAEVRSETRTEIRDQGRSISDLWGRVKSMEKRP